MKIRYFKASNGRFTVFRQSPSRVYLSAWIQCSATHVTNMGFSAKPFGPSGYPCAVEEIDKAEYTALQQRKNERILKQGGQLKYVAPSDSWVSNQ